MSFGHTPTQLISINKATIIRNMTTITRVLEDARRNPSGIAFSELAKLCEHYFGQPRQSGSHLIFRTPWPGDPRVNIQDKNGKAKPYQVRQVLAAIEKIEHG